MFFKFLQNGTKLYFYLHDVAYSPVVVADQCGISLQQLFS